LYNYETDLLYVVEWIDELDSFKMDSLFTSKFLFMVTSF